MLMARWSREMALRSPCSLPLVAAPRLSINLAARANLSGPEDPSVPSSQVELWSPIYLVRGTPRWVGIVTYINAPNTNTSPNAAATCTTKPRTCQPASQFRVGSYHCPGVSIRESLPDKSARSSPRRDRRLSLASLKPSLQPVCDRPHANGKQPRPTTPLPSAAADNQVA